MLNTYEGPQSLNMQILQSTDFNNGWNAAIAQCLNEITILATFSFWTDPLIKVSEIYKRFECLKR